MKYGVVFSKQSNNIGDDIQTYAAMQLLPKVDYYIDRDNMNSFNSEEEVKLICNGWFMNNPSNWPPSKNISPLFISFHVTHSNNSKQILISDKHKAYYKLKEPIGCRDYQTMIDFQNIGVNSYYSGCLTLTLKNQFNTRNSDIYCVDAFYNLGKPLQKRCTEMLFPKSIMKNVKFLEQDRSKMSYSVEERLAEAKKIIDIYSQAKLVVTSRIHCALPCLALGTPVLFIDVGFKTDDERNRFSGIIDYMNVINNSSFPYTSFEKKDRWLRRFNIDKFLLKIKKVNINWESPNLNPVDINNLSDNIREKIRNFISL